MSRAVKESNLAKEIKKDYLKKHLEEVIGLIERWIGELDAPPPLGPREGSLAWRSVYSPATEQDPDANHMLRRHVRSRTLWKHHAVWQANMDKVWNLTQRVQEKAMDRVAERARKKVRKYTQDYGSVALWKAFDLACGREPDITYREPDNRVGLACGAYTIELSAQSTSERSSVKSEHRRLTRYLADLDEMWELAAMWGEVTALQDRMRAIAGQALKSRDILYPCRFCRHLWK